MAVYGHSPSQITLKLMNEIKNASETFLQDVINGLTQNPKSLSSKYFYDAAGDKLFQKIMGLSEYYLTRKEFEIFENQHAAIFGKILRYSQDFNLVELGAGDGMKTKILLRYLRSKPEINFTYFPVDISGSVLQELKDNLESELPEIDVHPIQNTYRNAMKERVWENGKPSLILFLGSNIGNFSLNESKDVLLHVAQGTQTHDWLLLGVDLKKDPSIILQAYNDKQGVTRDFNLNLLKRINRELDANFDLEQFTHWPMYDPLTGECRSYLISQKEQLVTIGAANKLIRFEAFEPIFTEISRKFSESEISQLASECGFKVVDFFTDSENYFTDVLWQRI